LSRPHTEYGSAAIEQIIATGLHEYLEGPGTASLERAIALNSVVNRAVSVEAGRTPKTRTAAVAVGLDAGDSTPLSVTRRGGGIEELDVGVWVAMI